MILVYSHKRSNRLEYILSLLLGRLLGAEWKLTHTKDDFSGYGGPKISYGMAGPELGGISVPSHGFLMERGVSAFRPQIGGGSDMPELFPVSGKNYDLGFDILSAGFYLVSRYEEYLPHSADEHGRFPASASLAYKNGFLDKAVVNRYALIIKDLILERYPDYPFHATAFSFIPTYDVDVAYAYKGRSLLRNLFGILRSAGQRDLHSLGQRFRVLAGREKDPFDTYDFQLELFKKSGIRAFYFFLLGDYGPYDRNLAYFSRELFLLIKTLGDYAHIGIHPSYASNEQAGMLKIEISRLSGIMKENIAFSRQHYLRLRFPDTCQKLLKHNILYDFSLGFAEQPGFRAGICSPFPFYDLESEKETPLILVPLAVMDGSLRDYMGLSPSAATRLSLNLLREAEHAGGCFTTLWHNEALSEQGRWKGWKQVYRIIYNEAWSRHKKNYDPVYQA